LATLRFGLAVSRAGVGDVVVDVGRSAGSGGELGLAGQVGGVGIGAEVVVEGDVLAEDDDDVLDDRWG
jgi:hypothetical protein